MIDVHNTDNASKPAQETSGIHVLDRAFSVLSAFRPEDPPLTLTELATRTGLYKSTLLRIANALIYHHFMIRLDNGRYRLGSAPFRLGAVYQSSLNLGDILLPLMRELNRETGEAISFHVREKNHRVCLYRLESSFRVRAEVRQGDVQPLERGAGGRVLLAFAGESGDIYNTVRQRFYYISCGERDPETAGISAPVFGSSQTLVGALGIVGPINRLNQSVLENLRPQLLRICARATELLGGNPEEMLDSLSNAV